MGRVTAHRAVVVAGFAKMNSMADSIMIPICLNCGFKQSLVFIN